MPGIYRVSSASLGDGLAITISDLTQLRRALQTLETQHSVLAKVNAELRSEVIRRRRLEAELKQLAATDPLTGVANRRGFTDAMAEQFDLAMSSGAIPALIVFDVDDFKAINDCHGHPFGDIVLQRIAEAVSGRLGESAVLGRLGGEEFAIFLHGNDQESVRRIAETLRQAVAKIRYDDVAEVPVTVTASFGVAMAIDTGGGVEELIAAADDALYSAKRSGRNRVECCREGLWKRAAGST
jgi:diguanylate cyclase (GGDEF)-like protein